MVSPFWFIRVFAQTPGGLNIPAWAWVLLGMIVLIILLGLLLGARTSVDRSPSIRDSNVGTSTKTVIPQTGANGENVGIPQTGVQPQRPGIPPAAVQEAEGPVNNDDLTLIEGIGPGIAQVLNDAGITKFEQLASMNVNDLRQVISRSGLRSGDPETWPEQARLAAAGRWSELRTWQEQLRNSA